MTVMLRKAELPEFVTLMRWQNVGQYSLPIEVTYRPPLTSLDQFVSQPVEVKQATSIATDIAGVDCPRAAAVQRHKPAASKSLINMSGAACFLAFQSWRARDPVEPLPKTRGIGFAEINLEPGVRIRG